MKPLRQQAQELARPKTERETFAGAVARSLGPEAGQRVAELEEFAAQMAEALPDRIALAKLQRLIYGPKTEKSKDVCPEDPPGEKPGPKPKARGHGRKKHGDYPGARNIFVAHTNLKPGDPCPRCGQGGLIELPPANTISVDAQPPLSATRHQQQRFRCVPCGTVFTAPLPPEAPKSKYADSVGVMLGLLRFGYGVPNYRLARMQELLGVPMAESTQWGVMAEVAGTLKLIFDALKITAAQASLFYIDDTPMRVQELKKKGAAEAGESDGERKKKKKRTGIFTSVILAQSTGRQVMLYLTGNLYAAERLKEVLGFRKEDLPIPIQMSDALSWNGSQGYSYLEALCLTHGRREFVDLVKFFPEATRRVIGDLRSVYKTDAEAREQNLSPEARLKLHQDHSGPVMEQLKLWMEAELAEKRVEPNGGLGQAMKYMLKYWAGLTLFLREPGAPLDNSIAERAIKRAVLHRKNSMSYKTQKGAEVGDTFMSLIETCRANRVNPYDYLMALTTHAKAVEADPARWLPWNYHENLLSAAA